MHPVPGFYANAETPPSTDKLACSLIMAELRGPLHTVALRGANSAYD